MTGNTNSKATKKATSQQHSTSPNTRIIKSTKNQNQQTVMPYLREASFVFGVICFLHVVMCSFVLF